MTKSLEPDAKSQEQLLWLRRNWRQDGRQMKLLASTWYGPRQVVWPAKMEQLRN